MRIAIRLLAGGLVLLLLVLVAVTVAVAWFVDPEDYREAISGAVESRTGRRLAIDGELDLDLFPCCGLRVGSARLGNPPGFDAPDFATISGARVGLRVWPLLTRRELVIGEIVLESPSVWLQRRADGSVNWQFDEGAAPGADAPSADAAAAPTLSVAGVRVSDATLRYVDEPAGTDLRIEALQLSAGAVAPGRAFPVELSFRAGTADGLAARVALAAEATVDAELAAAQLDGLRAELDLSGGPLGAAGLAGTVGATALDADIEAGSLAVDGLTAKFSSRDGLAAGADGEGELAAASLALSPSGQLSLRELTGTVAARGGSLPPEGVTASLLARAIAFDPDSGAGRVDGGTVRGSGAGAAFNLTAAGDFDGDGSGLAGELRIEPLDPRAVARALDVTLPATADPAVLDRAELSAGWTLGADGLRLAAVDARLDDSRITGTAAVSNFETPAYGFDLRVDALDLDRYLAPEDQSAAPSSGGAGGDEELPLETLRELRGRGVLRFDRLSVLDLSLAEVTANVDAGNGVIRVDPLGGRLYEGAWTGSLRLDARGDALALATTQRVESVALGGLLADLADVDRLRGLVTGRAELQGTGATTDALLGSLTGELGMTLADGVFEGLDVWHEIRVARALIRREPAPARSGPARTPITALELGGRLADGRLASDRLVAQIPFLRLRGRGTAGLTDQRLDYRFDAEVFETPTFADGETLDDLLGLTIPLTLTGTVDAPKLGVDLAGLARGKVEQRLREKLIEKLELDEPPDADDKSGEPPAEESPRDVLKRGLRDLLGR